MAKKTAPKRKKTRKKTSRKLSPKQQLSLVKKQERLLEKEYDAARERFHAARQQRAELEAQLQGIYPGVFVVTNTMWERRPVAAKVVGVKAGMHNRWRADIRIVNKAGLVNKRYCRGRCISPNHWFKVVAQQDIAQELAKHEQEVKAKRGKRRAQTG